MAVTKNKEYIFNLMRSKSVSNWKILDNKEKIDEYSGSDIDESIVCLNSAIDAFSGSGIITIVLHRKANEELAEGGDLKTGVYKIKFDLSQKSIAQSVNGTDEIAGLIRQNESLKYENKIEQLQQQINSLTEMLSGVEEEEEEEMDQPNNIFIESIKPHIPAITGAILMKLGLMPQQVQPINGIDTDNEISALNSVQYIEELLTIDPEFTNRLKKLVYLAKNDNGTYKLAVNFLNNLVSDSKVNEAKD